MARQQAIGLSAEGRLTAPCNAASWTPEVFDFYGDPDSILRKMDRIDMELGERRIFMLLTESKDRAQIRFFEQVEGDSYAVATWDGESLDGADADLAKTILANRGIHCVGEQVRGLLDSFGLELGAAVPAPANARAAFAHTVRAHGSAFVRATTALLC
jgi:hypothetical protein